MSNPHITIIEGIFTDKSCQRMMIPVESSHPAELIELITGRRTGTRWETDEELKTRMLEGIKDG